MTVDPFVVGGGLVASEGRRVLVEDADRAEVFDLFRWFRLAAAL